MAGTLKLPLIDLSDSDRVSTSKLIRQACVDSGFFYIVNHGIEEEMLKQLFDQSKKFFSLPMQERMKLLRVGLVGYTPLYAETLDASVNSKGDLKESFYIGPIEGSMSSQNQWPPEGNSRTSALLASSDGTILRENNLYLQLFRTSPLEHLEHKPDVFTAQQRVADIIYMVPLFEFLNVYEFMGIMSIGFLVLRTIGKKILSLLALALNLDESFFEQVGALNEPMGFLRLLRYPGELATSDEETYGASAHSDYGMITLLATDGVRGLQICREKDTQPRIWEDVPHINGAFIVNIGDMMERWTNCLFRSTLHRVLSTTEERYSVAFFFDPDDNCVVQCLESCCSEAFLPRFPPIRSGDYLRERFNSTYL